MGHEGLPDTDDEKAETRTKGLRIQSYREQVLQLSQKVGELREKVILTEEDLQAHRQLLKDEEDALDLLLTDGRQILGG